MEESEHRKLRLKAMRMEAAEAEASSTVDTPLVPAHLSNPLAEPSASLLVQENSPLAARFDFYTDPMAAFSGNRRKSQKTYQNTPNHFSSNANSASPELRNLNMTPSPSHQYNQSNYSDQRMNEAPGHTPNSWRSPIGMASPFPQQLGTPPVWNKPDGSGGHRFPPNSPNVGSFPPNPLTIGNFSPSSPMVAGFPSPGFGRGGSPSPTPGRGRGYQFNNHPNLNYGQGGSPYPNAGRSNGPQFNNSGSPCSGRGGSPSPYTGRSSPSPYTGRSSPSPYTGRSSGHRFSNNTSSGSGRGHGRGRGFQGSATARERPELYYNRSMLDDPWKWLKPVVRKLTMAEESSSTPSSLKSWLPKSSSRVKDTVSETVTGCRSKLSLAESLAASYEEAAALAASFEEAPAAAGVDVKNE